MNTVDILTGTFDATFAPVRGGHPDDLDLVLRWVVLGGGLEPDDRDLVTVEVCPEHQPEDEPDDCPYGSILYEVVPYIAGRPDALAVKLDVAFTHLQGPVAVDERILLDWCVDQGIEVSDAHWVTVDGPNGPEDRKAIVIVACPVHRTSECPDTSSRDEHAGVRCTHDETVYAVEVVGAEWIGG